MADENAMTNGVASSEADDQREDSFYDVDDRENEKKLKQKVEALEKENRSLVASKQEIEDQVLKLTAENESLKSNGSEMQMKLEKMETEVVEGRGAMEGIARRAWELETEISRLQHDWLTAMNVGDEAKVEILELKRVVGEKEAKLEEIKNEKAEIEMKVRELERKAGVLEVREMEEKSKKLRVEEELREKIGEKEIEIFEYKKRINDLENQIAKKGILEEKLKDSEGKVKEMEVKMLELKKEAEKAIGGLKERTVEVINGIEIENKEMGLKGLKLQWPVVAVGSASAVVAVAAAVVYLRYARRT